MAQNRRSGFIRLTFLLFMAVTAATSYAQLFTSFLQGNDVKAIAGQTVVDSNNLPSLHLWFATNRGLRKYDQQTVSEIPIVTDNGVFELESLEDLLFDDQQRLWVASSRRGLFVLDDDIWLHFDVSSGVASDTLRALLFDSQSRLWIATKDQGVGILDVAAGTWHRITKNMYEVFENGAWVIRGRLQDFGGLQFSNSVRDLAEDSQGNIWIATDGGLVKFSGDLNRVAVCEEWCYCLENQVVHSLGTDGDGQIWAGTESSGAYRISDVCQADCFFGPSTCSSNKNLRTPQLLSNKVLAIQTDLAGNLWFGSDLGVCRYNPDLDTPGSTTNPFRCLTKADHPGIRAVEALFVDSDNNLWLGMSKLSNQGVLRLNSNWLTFGDESLSSLFVKGLLVVEDVMWVATLTQIVRIRGEELLQPFFRADPKRFHSTLAPADSNRVWVGTNGSGVFRFDRNSQKDDRGRIDLDPNGGNLPRNQVNQVIQSGDEVWIATDDGLGRYCTTTGTLTVYTVDSGLLHNQVRAIAFESPTRFWVGSRAGVNVIDAVAEQWLESFTVANGLSGNSVTFLAYDSSTGQMWVGTNGAGISIYDGTDWMYLDKTTGLADNVISQIVFSEKNEVWVATPQGVSRRDQNGIWCTFTTASGLASDFVQSLALQGDSLRWFGTWGAGVTRYRPPRSLPETFLRNRFDIIDQDAVTYFFTAADLNSKPNEFRFRFWPDSGEPVVTSNSFVSVPSPEPGRYTFNVQTIDRDGNLDPTPARDVFYRIDAQFGGEVVFRDAIGAVSLYVPPGNLFEAKSISINVLDAAELTDPLTVVGYSLVSSAPGATIKGASLAISFRDSLNYRSQPLGIFLQSGQSWTPIGGTKSMAGDSITVTTAIEEFGTYAIRTAVVTDTKEAALDIQPRVISPKSPDLKFGGKARISFTLDRERTVTVKVYDLGGRLVKNVLTAQPLLAGANTVEWDGTNNDGNPCRSGLYVVFLDMGGKAETMTILVSNSFRGL